MWSLFGEVSLYLLLIATGFAFAAGFLRYVNRPRPASSPPASSRPEPCPTHGRIHRGPTGEPIPCPLPRPPGSMVRVIDKSGAGGVLVKLELPSAPSSAVRAAGGVQVEEEAPPTTPSARMGGAR